MDKVWIVESEWRNYNEDPIDDYEHRILGVFKTEEAAVNYILEQLDAVLKCKGDDTEYDILRGVCFAELPTKEDLMSTKTFKFYDHLDIEERVAYFEVSVQD